MTNPINTGKVTGRRQLKFTNLQDILNDVEQLARAKEIRPLGNWSAGQVLQHLTMTMNNSIDGFPTFVPGAIRFLVRWLMKRRFLTQPMPAGFRLPARGAAMLPPVTSLEEG